MTTYAKFTEHNEWEGETWHFWIPINGNATALETLDAAIDARNAVNAEASDKSPFELDLTPVPEAEVDAVIKRTADDCGYMMPHTKLAGSLVISPEVLARLESGDPEGEDEFYKGGIRDFMVTEPVK